MDILIFLLASLIIIVWILLPFAVFGIKERLDKLLKSMEHTNAQLQYQSERLHAIQTNTDDKTEDEKSPS